jgi:multidrug efflux system membrane fusion protein
LNDTEPGARRERHAAPPPLPGEEPAAPAPPSRPRARERRRWGIVAAVVVVLLVVAGVVARLRAGPASRAGQAGAAAAAQRPVPVAVAAATRRDVPIYLEGLGNVIAIQTVTVRTQVDGRLESVLFREGQLVRKGQVLAQVDPRPFLAQLHQAQGALARDEAQLRNARINVERDRQLVSQNLIAQQQLDADVAAAGQLEGAVQMDRASIETARLNVQYARITSPLDGVTGIRVVDPGNVVHASDQNGIVVVSQVDPAAVIFSLPQDQLGPVSQQLARGPLQVDVFGNDAVTPLGSGRLEVIDNSINAATSTVRLKAVVPNPRRVLWPNQFVNARLRLETRRGALVVPSIAIQRGPSGTFVYVVGSDGTAVMRPVTVEITQGIVAIVAKGVSEGEQVVVEGQNQLRPGVKVAPREAGAGGGARMAAEGAQGGGAPPAGAQPGGTRGRGAQPGGAQAGAGAAGGGGGGR